MSDTPRHKTKHGLMPMVMRSFLIVAVLMFLMGAVIVQALNSIRSLSLDTRDNVLESVSDNLRTAVNLEKLSRFAQIVYRSKDPLERRRFMHAARILSQDAAFDQNESVALLAENVAESLREIHYLRGKQAESNEKAESILDALQKEYRNPSLENNPVSLAFKALRDLGKDDFYSDLLQLQNVAEGISQARPELGTHLDKLNETLIASRLMEKQIGRLWKSASYRLEETIGQVSIQTVQTASERFTAISSQAERALYLGAACFLMFFACLVSIVALIRRDILKPVLESVTILGQVQRGETPNRFPEARLRELDDIGLAVERSARLMRQIAERTDELERTNAALVREISEHRKTERQLAAAKAAAEDAGRAKSDFLAGMSHEIRTPMNSILGMADLMLETDLTDQQRRYIDIFKSSGQLLLGILNDVLDFSKIEAGQLELNAEPFELATSIEEVSGIVQDKADIKGLVFEASIAADVPAVLIGDRVRLCQVMLNLLDNAVKFTEKGYVKLEVTSEPESTPDKTWLTFAVSDTGIGIPSHMQESIFGRFTQADASTTRKYGGSGLGLAICHALVDLMGGSINMASTEGAGTRFSFTIPLEVGKTEQKSDLPEKDRLKQLEMQLHDLAPAVLIAEDSASNRDLIELYLMTSAGRIDFAGDGVEAVNLFRNGDYDAILMDIQMPEMDGYGATRMIRAIEKDEYRKSVPIIALTANATQEDQKRCLLAGCDYYLSKPVSKVNLLEALRSMLPGSLL